MGGFFAVTSKSDCIADLFYGTDYHSHLGTRRGGMVVRGESGFKRNIHDISNTPFRTKFEDDLPKHMGNMGMGVISDYEDQPLFIASHHGRYAIVTVGRVHNLDELADELVGKNGFHMAELKGNEVNQTEVVAALINQEETIAAGIQNVQQKIDGSISLMLLTDKGVYAARDRLGRTPIIIGQKDGAFAATLETCALTNLGYVAEKFLGPGETVLMTPDGVEPVLPAGDKMQICSFLWVYYGYPASVYENINVEAVRNRCGAALARRDSVEADVVAGIPDSGIGHAIGYASEKGIPYRRPFVKYTPTWPRSFMPQEQRVRDLVAKMKLIPVEELIVGKKLMFCEDSIVRGTQLRDIITRLFDAGAKEIHMRPACPPLTYGCKYLNFSQSKSELDLAARKAIKEIEGDSAVDLDQYSDCSTSKYVNMIEVICKHLGLTTLAYQRLDDMIEAIGMPREKLCTYCWNGEDLYSNEP